ncbi:MAG: SDR family NAD(P)-dependent oxidoreductase [Bacteroidota bacterium]
MRHLIITGASKGLGEAIATEALTAYDHVWCISRSESEKLASTATSAYHFLAADLGKPQQVDSCLQQLWEHIDVTSATAIHLVNNAASLSPIGLAGHKDRISSMRSSLRLNVDAVITFCEWFLEKTATAAIDKRILNVSSGAGRKDYPAWSVYCASKAAVDRYSTCVAVEQKDAAHPGSIVSLAPGVIATDMQALIRSQKKEDFPLLDRFIQLKEEGKLWAPSYAASLLLGFLQHDSFGQDPLVDLRDWEGQLSN